MSVRVEKPIVYLITNGDATDLNLLEPRHRILEIIRVAVAEKISLIQIREKRLCTRALFELTMAAVEITRGSATRLLVNDRADVALAAGADGVHLAQNSLAAGVIRKNFPSGFIIGVSTHSIEEVTDASKSGADFAVFGPVFETPGKSDATGLDDLSTICSDLKPFQVIGLGGINESNYKSILRAGAAGIAAIRFLNNAGSLRTVSRNLAHDRSNERY